MPGGGVATEASRHHHPRPNSIMPNHAPALLSVFRVMRPGLNQQQLPLSNPTLERTASRSVVTTTAPGRDAHARRRRRRRQTLQTPVAVLLERPGEREHSGGHRPPESPPGRAALLSPKRSRVVVCRGKKCPLRKGGCRLRGARCVRQN